MKKILKRIQVTDAQRAAITAAVVALAEITEAYGRANPDTRFCINFDIEWEYDFSDDERAKWAWRAIPRWKCGGVTTEGYGKTLEAALDSHFSTTDAQKKRESAKRYRESADRMEQEAAELEETAAAEGSNTHSTERVATPQIHG